MVHTTKSASKSAVFVLACDRAQPCRAAQSAWITFGWATSGFEKWMVLFLLRAESVVRDHRARWTNSLLELRKCIPQDVITQRQLNSVRTSCLTVARTSHFQNQKPARTSQSKSHMES